MNRRQNMVKRHAGSGIPHGHRNIGTAPKPSPIHHGSGKPVGVVHAPPAPGGAVNKGGTFSMGRLGGKKQTSSGDYAKYSKGK
jgi:hypothetical protein